MDFRKQSASCEEARQMDMVAYLSALGHEPIKVRKFDYWYLSPLREEKTPSFKINRKLNRWYDHGLGQGGNLIDFATRYHHCTVGEFLRALSGNLSFHQPITTPKKKEEENKGSRIAILRERPLQSFPLCRYLRQRRIPLALARRYCKEVSYDLNGKEYFGIGFKNNSGGYELRNPYFKASSSPKDITTFDNGAGEAAVFEGFMDFLSFLAIPKHQQPTQRDFVILNSVAFFEKARPFMERHETIRLYLDRDATGQNHSRHALSLNTKYRDESGLYQHYKDLNDWLMSLAKGQKKKVGQKL
jgi:hypothetical protein